MTERRYNEDEVALILRKAVDAGADDRATATGKGMSLSELKEIGIEVGIDAARIEDAARTLERRDDRPITGSVLGLPTTAQLDRVVPVRLVPEDLPSPWTLYAANSPAKALSRRFSRASNGEPEAAWAAVTFPFGPRATRRGFVSSETTETG